MKEVEPDSSNPRQRLIVLGASNVAINLPRVVSLAQHWCERDLELFVACGHGRSYGTASRVLGRELPAIRSCRLWDSLAKRPQCPTSALITDIGNDILYGASPDQIISWVRESAARILDSAGRVTITALPLDRVRELRRWQFNLLRRALFPSSCAGLAETLEKVEAVQSLLTEFAREQEIQLVQQPLEWFGWDPIHIRRAERNRAWMALLSAATGADFSAAKFSILWPPKIQVRRFAPAEQKILGILRPRKQPVFASRDGVRVWCY